VGGLSREVDWGETLGLSVGGRRQEVVFEREEWCVLDAHCVQLAIVLSFFFFLVCVLAWLLLCLVEREGGISNVQLAKRQRRRKAEHACFTFVVYFSLTGEATPSSTMSLVTYTSCVELSRPDNTHYYRNPLEATLRLA
jgi:hypothetical protein